MAVDDWIKKRKKLFHDPRTIGIARRLKVPRQYVLGCLDLFWSLADSHADSSGFVANYTSELIDEIVHHEGFAAAVVAETSAHEDGPWLILRNGGAVFPDYGAHNGTTAKTRAEDTKKKRAQREKSKCPEKPGTNVPEKPGLEKRREEKKNNQPLAAEPPGGETPNDDPPKKQPKPRDPHFDAVAEVSNSDPRVKSQAGFIAKFAHELRQADYTAEQIREAGRRYTAEMGSKPSPSALAKWITRLLAGERIRGEDGRKETAAEIRERVQRESEQRRRERGR